MFTVKPLFFSRTTPNGPENSQRIDTAMQLVLYEAELNGIKWELLEDSDVIKLTYKDKVNYFRNRAPSTTHIPAAKICQDKASTKSFLKSAGIPTVKGFVVYSTDTKEYLLQIFNSLNKPLVVKPTHGTHGDAVHVGIFSMDEYLLFIKNYFSHPLYTGGVLVEEMFVGNEYRIMATRDKVLAIIERVPASVIGDGTHTIKELIEAKNIEPIRNISPDVYPHIEIDEDLILVLQRQEKTVEYLPRKDEKINLRSISNVMVGGDTIDRTDEVHPSVNQIALKTIQAIPGLSWGGVDFLTKNVYEEQHEDSYRILEINCAPEFDMHELPMEGKRRPVAKEFLKLLFPDLQ